MSQDEASYLTQETEDSKKRKATVESGFEENRNEAEETTTKKKPRLKDEEQTSDQEEPETGPNKPGDYYENRNFVVNGGVMASKQTGEIHHHVNNSRYGIKYLSLAKCVQITDKSLIFLHIKYLNLRGCSQVTDKSLKHFTGFHGLVNYDKATQQYEEKGDMLITPGLESLRLLPAIPLYLKSLDLSKCSITNKSIEYLCRLVSVKPDILKRLSLRSCENITDEGVRLLAIYCRNLQHLNVAKCSKVTSISLRDIKRNCKCCIIQHTNFSFC